jgi:hypothetical protein
MRLADHRRPGRCEHSRHREGSPPEFFTIRGSTVDDRTRTSTMSDFIFSFGFCTPEQRLANDANGWDDESSAMLSIRATSAAEAETWGREVAEAFCAHLYRRSPVWTGDPPSWKEDGFACWVSDPRASVESGSPEVWVAVGEMPDVNAL